MLDHRDLLGEGRFGEDVATPRAGMGEHPGSHHRHAVSLGIEAADQVGADLGNGVRRGRMERAFLVDRQFLLGHAAEHLGGGADMDDGLGGIFPQRRQYPFRALDVGVHGIER